MMSTNSNGRRAPKYETEEMLELRRQGLTYQQIGNRYGVCYQTVNSRLGLWKRGDPRSPMEVAKKYRFGPYAERRP